jgi:hypothetical protein
MEVSAKVKSKTVNKKLFAFLRTSARLEEKIDIASKILFQIKRNDQLNQGNFLFRDKDII